MVVPMKKIAVLLPAADRETFLDELAQLGVVHINERPEESHSQKLEQVMGTVKRLKTVHEALEKIAKVSEGTGNGAGKLQGLATEAVVKEYTALEQQREANGQLVAALEKDVAVLTPWGNFDPDLIEKLKATDITLRFFETTAKKFAQLQLGDTPHTIIATGSTVNFVVVDRGGATEIDAEEVSLPKKSIVVLTKEIADLRQERVTITAKIAALVADRAVLSAEIVRLQQDESFERARLSLEDGAQGAVLLLNGWLPTMQEKQARELLGRRTVWFAITNPTLEDKPPVRLKNSVFASLFEPITNMFSLPDYFELDPTPFFAPFFMFFYGMCLGDVGYGSIILFLALVLVFKGPPKLKNIFILGSFLGGMTILNGFFLNTFFGATIFNVEGAKGIAGEGGVIPFLSSHVIGGKTEFPAITFAIYIGVVQMLLGMVLQIVNRVRNQGLIYAIQPMCYMPLTLAAFIAMCKADFLAMGTYSINSLHIGAAIAAVPSSVLFVLLGIGILPFMFFNTPKMKIWFRPLKFLWEFYNFTNGFVSNVLSYLRLFALGLASGLLGKAFNDIALMLVTNDQGQVSLGTPLIVFTILIMVIGHSLNFGLSALGAYVHSVRLIFVEFYSNLSFQGGGKSYNPFTKNVTNNS